MWNQSFAAHCVTIHAACLQRISSKTCRQDICRNFVLQFARDLAACMESLDILISKGQYVFVELKARIVLDFITARKLV